MKIYKVAHENIIYPKEYRIIEIMKEDVEGYIKRSIPYYDMIESIPENEWYKSRGRRGIY